MTSSKICKEGPDKNEEVRQGQKDVLSLRASAIDMLTDKVTLHKANTKILESMGESLSVIETNDLENQIECLEQAQVRAEGSMAEL